MVVRLQKTQNGYIIPLTAEMVDALRLHEGAQVEVLPVTGMAEETQPPIRYASADEAMKIHRQTGPHHAEAYRELAK